MINNRSWRKGGVMIILGLLLLLAFNAVLAISVAFALALIAEVGASALLAI